MTRVTPHETAVIAALKSNRKRWLTNSEIAAIAGVHERTARKHTRKLVGEGAVEMRPTFPGYTFKLQ